MTDPPSRILIIKVTSIGDVAHTLPSSLALARRWPAARLDWLVDPMAAGIVADVPWVSRVIEVDTMHRRYRGHAWLAHLRQVRAALRSEGYDLAIDFQGLFRTSLWTRWSGAPLRVGRGRWPWLGRSVSMLSPRRTPHAVENTARTLAPLGIDVDGIDERFRSDGAPAIRERMLAHGRRAAAALGLAAPFWVWIPQAAWPSKALPLGGLDGLPGPGPHVVIGDAAFASARLPARGRWINAAGRFSLAESVGLALLAEQVIAADTGPAQLAALLGARIVGCFGPTDPRRTGLRGPLATNVHGPCRPCYRHACARAGACVGEAVARALSEVKG
jgi:ADP-heptose:LPS heptosyltransferase